MINWLTNDAISNYIVFVAGLIVGLIAEIIRVRVQKRKPSIIEVQREKDSSLISISPEARKRLQITYSQKESKVIDELQQITLNVENKGEQPIQNVELGIVLENADYDNLLEVIVEDALWDSRNSSSDLAYTPDGDLEIRICTSFINPHKEYSDSLKVQIYSSKAVIIKNVVGGGPGWSARYFDKVGYNDKLQATLMQIAKLILRSYYK
jgi:hypothetical protein